MSDLIARLLADPHGFELFQALHLLERSAGGRALLGTSVGRDEAIELRADPSLAFASSDITSIERTGAHDSQGAPFRVVSPAMALAGAQGPLPVAFTELLLERQRRRDPSGLAFLDIFNQRTLAFLYRSRVKHRLSLQSTPPAESPVARLIDALSGLEMSNARHAPAELRPWLRHAALQAAAPRSMASMQSLLIDGMGLAVQGQSFRGAWIHLPAGERAVLGRSRQPGHQPLRLGLQGSLGTKAWDQAAAIECRVPELSRAALDDLLPGRPAHRRLSRLIEHHVQSRLRVEITAVLPENATRRCPLGQGAAPPGVQARLGHTSWLGGLGRKPATGTTATAHHQAQHTRFLLRT